MNLTTEQIVAGFALITEYRLTIAALQQRVIELEAEREPICGRCHKPNADGGVYHVDPLCGQVLDTGTSAGASS